MRVFAVIPALMLPGAAFAGTGEGASGFGMAGGILQMIASLAVVLGVILLCRHLANRFVGGTATGKGVPRYIRVVESRFLAPKKSLMLVEVGGEYLLLGSTGEGISLIKQIDMLESIEVVEDLSVSPRPAFSPADAVRSLLGLPGKRERVCVALGKRTG